MQLEYIKRINSLKLRSAKAGGYQHFQRVNSEVCVPHFGKFGVYRKPKQF